MHPFVAFSFSPEIICSPFLGMAPSPFWPQNYVMASWALVAEAQIDPLKGQRPLNPVPDSPGTGSWGLDDRKPISTPLNLNTIMSLGRA